MIPTLRSVSFMCNTTTYDAILRLTTMDQKSRQTRVMLIVLLLSSSIHIYRFPFKDKFHWNWLMFIAWKVRTLVTLWWKIHLIIYEVNNTQRSLPYVEWIYQVPDDDFRIHFCFCSTVKWVLKIIIKIYYYTGGGETLAWLASYEVGSPPPPLRDDLPSPVTAKPSSFLLRDPTRRLEYLAEPE